MDRLFYFGTDLRQAGHYFWSLSEGSMRSHGLSFPTGEYIGKWPFNPETLLEEKRKDSRKKGNVVCAREAGYTIIAIEGSCSDNRPGTKSVFFTDMDYRYKDFALEMVQTPIVKAIIKKFPFAVDWPFYPEINEQIQNHLK